MTDLSDSFSKLLISNSNFVKTYHLKKKPSGVRCRTSSSNSRPYKETKGHLGTLQITRSQPISELWSVSFKDPIWFHNENIMRMIIMIGIEKNGNNISITITMLVGIKLKIENKI